MHAQVSTKLRCVSLGMYEREPIKSYYAPKLLRCPDKSGSKSLSRQVGIEILIPTCRDSVRAAILGLLYGACFFDRSERHLRDVSERGNKAPSNHLSKTQSSTLLHCVPYSRSLCTKVSCMETGRCSASPYFPSYDPASTGNTKERHLRDVSERGNKAPSNHLSKTQSSTLLHCVPYSRPVQFPAPLHDAAFPVCQVSLLVAYGSLVFCFSKTACTNRLFLTAKYNFLRYCTASPIPPIALRPLFLLTSFIYVPKKLRIQRILFAGFNRRFRNVPNPPGKRKDNRSHPPLRFRQNGLLNTEDRKQAMIL